MLIDRIIEFLKTCKNNSANDWEIASALYPDFKRGKSTANGARISNIRRRCQNDGRIIQFTGNDFALKRDTDNIEMRKQ